MPNYNIYIPNAYEEKLKLLCQDEESVGQAAKRLLLSFLGGNQDHQISIPENELESLKEELIRLKDCDSQLGERIDQLETILLQSQPKTINDLLQRVEQIEKLIKPKKEAVKDSVQNHSQPDEGLTSIELSKRLGIADSTVYRWGKKGSNPSSTWILRDGLWFQN